MSVLSRSGGVWLGGVLQLVACRVAPGGTDPPGAESGLAPRRDQGSPDNWRATDEARHLIVADRGVGHASDQVWIVASWRSDVDPRGVVVAFPAEKSTAAEVADIANRLMDAGFNHAFVEPSPRSLEKRVAVAADLTSYKALGYRQRIEQGGPLRPTATVFWLDDRGGEVIGLLRAHPPFRVQAAIVLTSTRAPLRHSFPSESTGELQVLEIPAPGEGGLGHAEWTDILHFLDDVEHGLPGDDGTRRARPRK